MRLLRVKRVKSGRMIVEETQGWFDKTEGKMLLFIPSRLVDTFRDMPSLVIMHACGENLRRFRMDSSLLIS